MEFENLHDTCEMCGRAHRHSGEYNLPVCLDCRATLLNRPFPKWLYGFLLLILVLSAVSLYRFPSALEYGIGYQKGVQFAEDHKHVSALGEFEKLAKIFPGSAEVQYRLYGSYYENAKLDEAYGSLDKIIAIDSEPSEDFANKVNAITDKMSLYYDPTEGFIQLSEEIKDLSSEAKVLKIEGFIKVNPSDLVAAYVLCDLYFELDRYSDIELVLEPLCQTYGDWKPGLNTLIATKRELGKFDDARTYYESLIALNVEDPYSYVVGGKVELKQKNDAKALELVNKALALRPNDVYVHGMLAMVYYYMDNQGESKRYLDLFNGVADKDLENAEFVNAVVSGRLIWR